MKKITAILLAAAPLWLTGCISIQKTSPATTVTTPTAWEYKVARMPNMHYGDHQNTLNNTNSVSPLESLNARRQDFLNQLGKDGWIMIYEEAGTYYFKRPLK